MSLHLLLHGNIARVSTQELLRRKCKAHKPCKLFNMGSTHQNNGTPVPKAELRPFHLHSRCVPPDMHLQDIVLFANLCQLLGVASTCVDLPDMVTLFELLPGVGLVPVIHKTIVDLVDHQNL